MTNNANVLTLPEFRSLVRFFGSRGPLGFGVIDASVPDAEREKLQRKREEILDAFRHFRYEILPHLSDYFDPETGKPAVWNPDHTGPVSLPPRLDPNNSTTPFDEDQP